MLLCTYVNRHADVLWEKQECENVAVLPIIWEEDENSRWKCDDGQEKSETTARSSAWCPALAY